MPFLSAPQTKYKDSFLDAIREFQGEGLYLHWDVNAIAADFNSFVEGLHRRLSHPAPDWVPDSIFWLIGDDDETYIGRVSVRHALNDRLRILGGHIGYDIRPSQRRRGYGSLICKLGLEEAWKLGLRRVMLTCDEDNTASRKIIEAHGGILDSQDVVDGDAIRRYWLEVPPQPNSGTTEIEKAL